MADQALRGNKLTKQGRMGQRAPQDKQERNGDALEWLGTHTSGGIEGKPHSTREGRLSAGRNLLNRAWGQKYQTKKNKKGIPV